MKRLLALEASAGTGKTFALVVRYLSLLFQGAHPSTILALTFTNKAANEMFERITQTLSTLEESAELDAICENTNLSKAHILAQKGAVWAEFLKANLQIMTIDSFFVGILKRFSLYVGLSSDFLIENSIDREDIEIRFLKEALQENILYEDLISFSANETRRLEAIIQLLELLYDKEFDLSHYKPINSEAIETKILELYAKMQAHIQHCPHKSKGSMTKALSDVRHAKEILKKTWLERESLNYRTFTKCYSEELDALFFELKEYLRLYVLAKESLFFYHLHNLYALYKKVNHDVKSAKQKVSFSDITLLTHRLLQTFDKEFIYFRLDAKMEHILIDEFQDTSIMQFNILKPFIDEVVASQERSFFMVGDTKQSIYRFRGGAKELFSHVVQRYGVMRESMDRNFRSDRAVVTFVNETFSPHFESFVTQKANSDAMGFVQVLSSEALIESMLLMVERLRASGVANEDIAILAYTNDDILAIQEAIRERLGVQTQTESSSKLINYTPIRAIIELLKYLYFDEKIFLRNFMTLANLPDVKVHIKAFEGYFDDMQKLVRAIIDNFALFDGTNNLLKFLEIIKRYAHLGEFIFDYQNIDTPIIKTSQQGIQLLTIHKSKGLQFAHTIVMDRFKRKMPNNSPLIFDYERVELKRIYRRFSKREHLDSDYAQAIEKSRTLSDEDELNTLYVAFTRAKHSLMVVQNSAQNSAMALLELSDFAKGEIRAQKRAQEEERKLMLNIQERRHGKQEIKSKDKEQEDKDLRAIEFGLALHYSIEMLGGFSEEALPSALHNAKNRFAFNDFEAIERRLKHLLGSSAFLSLVDGATVHKEQALMIDGEFRQLDLLLEFETKWIIVDFKSSKNYLGKNIEQLKEYIEAMQKIDTTRAVEGYLCFILANKTELLRI